MLQRDPPAKSARLTTSPFLTAILPALLCLQPASQHTAQVTTPHTRTNPAMEMAARHITPLAAELAAYPYPLARAVRLSPQEARGTDIATTTDCKGWKRENFTLRLRAKGTTIERWIEEGSLTTIIGVETCDIFYFSTAPSHE